MVLAVVGDCCGDNCGNVYCGGDGDVCGDVCGDDGMYDAYGDYWSNLCFLLRLGSLWSCYD